MDMHAEEYERKLQLREIVYKHAFWDTKRKSFKRIEGGKRFVCENKQNIDIKNVILRDEDLLDATEKYM